MFVPLHKGKGERTECKNYIGISLVNVGERLTNMESKRISDHRGVSGSNQRVYGFKTWKKEYDKVNMKAL